MTLHTKDERKYQILERACAFFESNLAGSQGERYLKEKRGLKDETIKEFRLGYGQSERDALLKYLSHDFNFEELHELRLVHRAENEYEDYKDLEYKIPYARGDSFRNRVMIPLLDSEKRVSAFAGRNVCDCVNCAGFKYFDTLYAEGFFSRGRDLFGLVHAKEDIKKTGQVIVVEGYFDVIKAYQEGIRNIVSVFGTHFTTEHFNLLQPFGDLDIVFCFDGDEAGRRATEKALKDFADRKNLRALVLPEGEDPASLLEKGKDFRELFY